MRTPTQTIKFEAGESGKPYEAYDAAIAWCKENDFSFGPICEAMPTALMKFKTVVRGYDELTEEEIDKIDGVIISPLCNFEKDDVTICIFNNMENETKNPDAESRKYFAGLAMQSLIQAADKRYSDNGELYEILTKDAIRFADEMLKRLEE